MERVIQRLESAKKALNSFTDVLSMEFTDVVRDAAIKRFEFTLEISWKLAQSYLREREAMDLPSPRRVIRACFEMGFLDEAQTKAYLDMLNDRNLTSHTYDEATADAIYSRLDNYRTLIAHLIQAIEKNLVQDYS